MIGGRMPRLESANQKMARQLRAALSSVLRRIVDVTDLPIQTMKYSEFLKTLPLPTSMHVFRMLPLHGGSLLVLEPKLVFALIDSFFGGAGNANITVEARDFTPIESRMIVRIANLVFEEMERAWEPLEAIRVELERSETNPQFINIAAPNDVVFIVQFQVEIDETHGIIALCIPYSTFEPIRSKLYAGFQEERSSVDLKWIRRLLTHVRELEVEVSAEIGSAEVSMETLLYLRTGDIIRLDQDCDSALLVKVEGVPKFKGKACRVKQRTALLLTDRIMPTEEDLEENGHE
jgi:flagellar motor switch protein FliM